MAPTSDRPAGIDLVARYEAGLGIVSDRVAGETGRFDLRVGGRALRGLYAAPGRTLAFALPPCELHFCAAVAVAPDTWSRGDLSATRFRVLLDGEECLARTVDAVRNEGDRRWHDLALRIAAGAAGRTLALEAQAEGPGPCAWGVWGAPRAFRLDPPPDVAVDDRELSRSSREAEVARMLAMPLRRLNLGAGGFPLEGWINVDGGDGSHYDAPDDPRIVRLDVFEALAAIPDGSLDFVHSEQFLEHFTRQEGLRIAKECHRVLAPDGVVRVQVPDLELVVSLYRNELDFADWESVQLPHRLRHVGEARDPYGSLAPGERLTPAIMINNGFHMDGHRFLYDFETLAQTLALAGFARIARKRFGESGHAPLHGIDRHDGGHTGRSWVPRVALVVEATK